LHIQGYRVQYVNTYHAKSHVLDLELTEPIAEHGGQQQPCFVGQPA